MTERAHYYGEPEAQTTHERRTKRRLARLGAFTLGVCLAAAPLATVQALKETRVHDEAGIVPTTLTLTPHTSSLDLGIVGSLSSDRTYRGVGIHAQVDGPPIGSATASVGDVLSPQNIAAYTRLYQHPQEAIESYQDAVTQSFRDELLINELEFAGSLGALLLLLSSVSSGKGSVRQQKYWTASLISAAALTPSLLAAHNFHDWEQETARPEVAYALPSLDGTALEGTTADNPILSSAIERAAPKIKQFGERQEVLNAAFITSARASLEAQQNKLSGPRENEIAFMLGSDIHSNTVMNTLNTELIQTINATYGDDTVSFVGLAGDQTYGSVAEKTQATQEAAMSDGAPILAVMGNHDSDATKQQLNDAGIATLEGEPVDVDGTTLLGDIDPNLTKLFGMPNLRDPDISVDDYNDELYKTAQDSHPDVLLTHEAYNLAPFLDRTITQSDMDTWFADRTSSISYSDDTTPDIPANLVAYGHWHRYGIAPKVVWNSDGSWSVVAELNTTGGAIASPTFTHFSTPWSTPGQTASMMLFYKDTDSGLITGYQEYAVTTDGEYVISDRVDVGSPDGQPYDLSTINAQAKNKTPAQPGER